MESVALTDSLPLSGRDNNYVYDAEGHPRDARQGALLATGRTVSPDYFATLGMRLMRGRLLTNQDESGSSHAVVINQSMAERLWPHQDPLGRHLIDVGDEPTPTVWNKDAASVVVGVVSNTHGGSLASGFGDEVYLPMATNREQPVMYVLLRTRASTAEAAEDLRKVVKEADPLVPVTRVRSLNEVVAASVSAPRSLAILLLSFGVLALLIGGVGVYSLIAYVVSWRTREIGIRLAMGAMRWQIVSAIVKQSLLLAVGGSVAGLLAAALLMQFLRSFLFGVSVIDPLTFCTVPVVMLLLALFAAWLPARRAAGVDPMETLRNSESNGEDTQNLGKFCSVPQGRLSVAQDVVLGPSPISANVRDVFLQISHKIVILRGCDFFNSPCGLWPESSEEQLPTRSLGHRPTPRNRPSVMP